MGNYDTALERYIEALEIVRNSSNPIILATVLNNMASVYIIQKEYAKAEETLLEVLELTTDHNLPAQKSECLQQLAHLHRDLQDYPRAFDYLSQYHDEHKSIFNDKVTNGIIKYEADYLNEKTKQKAEIYRLQYVELVEKNNIITKKSKQLETALSQLSESNATKDKLFSIVAHDLRGPVANLQMSLEAMLAEEFSHSEQELMLTLLNEQTKSTHDLLENLLWWSQAQKDTMKLHFDTVFVKPQVETIAAIYLSNTQKKGIRLELDLAEDIRVKADKDALALILRNLIGNAVKFSPLHSTVTITSQIIGSKMQLDVADNGSGINPQILKAIRNRTQIQSIPGTAGEKGMGLGLSLCYEFAHKMRGKLSVCKKRKKGTCFMLELPLA
jgi:signal transduction histidine kinase